MAQHFMSRKLLIGGAAAIGAAILGKDRLLAHQPLSTHEMYPASSNYPDLSKSNSCMSKVLTPEMYNRLRDKATSHGWTLDDIIQSGVDTPSEEVFIPPAGCQAGDYESYQVFSEFFDKVIEERHDGFTKCDHHVSDLDPSKIVGGCCFDEDYVLSSRVRTGRSIRGLNFPPAISRAERRQIERLLSESLNNMQGEFKGRYYPLRKMTDDEINKSIEEHFLFHKPDSPVLARDWPDGRGLWHNDAKTFIVWINRNDHARIMSMQKGGNIGQVFNRFTKGLKAMETELRKKGWEYLKDERLGYVLTSPSNLGTGMRASVHIKLPLLSKDPRFDSFLNARRLQKREVIGAHANEEGTLDISNADRLGKTEVVLLQSVINGVDEMISIEKALEKGENVDRFFAKTPTDKNCNLKKKAWFG